MAQRSVKVPTRFTRSEQPAEFSALVTATRTQTRRVSRRSADSLRPSETSRQPQAPVDTPRAPHVVDQVPPAAPRHRDDPITVTEEAVIVGDLAERLVEMQLRNFAPLASVAVQRQTRSREEMLAICADPDFIKVVGWNGGEPVGFGVLTNVLEKVPEVSPDFFALKYPDPFSRRAVYFGVYITVDEPTRGLTVFWRVSTAMWQVPARASGVLAFDVCEFNREMFAAEEVAQQVAQPFPGSSVSVVDRQTWIVAELPAPIGG